MSALLGVWITSKFETNYTSSVPVIFSNIYQALAAYVYSVLADTFHLSLSFGLFSKTIQSKALLGISLCCTLGQSVFLQ